MQRLLYEFLCLKKGWLSQNQFLEVFAKAHSGPVNCLAYLPTSGLAPQVRPAPWTDHSNHCHFACVPHFDTDTNADSNCAYVYTKSSCLYISHLRRYIGTEFVRQKLQTVATLIASQQGSCRYTPLILHSAHHPFLTATPTAHTELYSSITTEPGDRAVHVDIAHNVYNCHAWRCASTGSNGPGPGARS
jgi:hypothetical protein